MVSCFRAVTEVFITSVSMIFALYRENEIFSSLINNRVYTLWAAQRESKIVN